jgi:predicted ATPase
LREAGISLYVPAAYAMLSDAYRLSGDRKAAIGALDEAFEVIGKTGELWCEPELYLQQGALRTGDRLAAEQSLQRALATARRQSAMVWTLRAALALARLWLEDGNRRAARELLPPICAEFTSGADDFYLQEAYSLLTEMD